MQKTVRGLVCHVIQGMNVARISQGVNVQDFTAALQQQPDQIGADESGSAVTITLIILFSGKFPLL